MKKIFIFNYRIIIISACYMMLGMSSWHLHAEQHNANNLFTVIEVENKSEKPLSELGDWLNERGISPYLQASQLYFNNPSAGLQTGKSEALTMFFAGLDFDLEKMSLIPGGKIHFLQLWVPFSHNWDYGTQVGDVLAGNPPPYIPKVAHLMHFTYEQLLPGDQFSFEIGKSNPGQYFGIPLCDSPFACVNTLLVNSVGFSPMPYSGWGAKIDYRITPNIRTSIGGWRTYKAYPFTTGWEGGFNGNGQGESALIAMNIARNAGWQQERYPLQWEMMVTHSYREYNEPYYTVNGTSQVYDSSSSPRRDSGVSALYVGAKKGIWRLDGGKEKDNPTPTALSIYGDVTHLLASNVDNGLGTLLHTGIVLSAPWQSRPLDHYSLNFSWLQLTKDEQLFLRDAFDSSAGQGWLPSRNQYQLSLTGNIFLTQNIELQLIGSRTWQMNNWANPYTNKIPKDGYSFFIQTNIYLDKLLGLTPSH